MSAPKLIRYNKAPGYLGISRQAFDALVRPYIREARAGRAVLFDRQELDGVAETWLNGQAVGDSADQEGIACQIKQQELRNEETSGILPRQSCYQTERNITFEEALVLRTGRSPRQCS